MIIHNCQQRSDEWNSLRIGRFTGSNFATFMGSGETRNRLLYEKMVERITGKSDGGGITNADIQRGVELEDIARINYEMETGNNVVQVGFIEQDEWVGCSPDGLVGEDGMIEIKCPKASVFLKHLIRGDIEKQYYIQIQFNLLVSGRKWCDFIRYNDNFPISIQRVFVDDECQQKIRDALKECILEVQEGINIYKQKGGQNVITEKVS